MSNNEIGAQQGRLGIATQPAERISSVARSLYDVNASDPDGKLIDRSDMGSDDVEQITRVMKSMARMREAEEALSKASQKFMQLSQTEMRAIHYLIVAANQKQVVTPGAIAHHLGITSASTTKLLDRLERGEHIVRSPHPTDRRSLSISVTDETHAVARDTVGRMHANRFMVAAALAPAEREVVIRFLNEVAERMTLRDEPWATGSASH
ncbi:MarR family winged helix-turn-helix transcriptional regulator [Homoserinimonas sp. OAct 916]|uniref:MarR family winged helix-turn-helix transcriptional regulator n=1 Tax=Homoserinimonas sp. OAct 916 TaxID=2211450 RepID=UPI000DBE6147|nr:MarR family transcriptional regulator [Homoserinimonas sp. OAct 916]